MPYRPKLTCPTLAFLDEVQRDFSVVWPRSFRAFCLRHAGASLSERYRSLRGRFIVDRDDLEKTNQLVGEGSWGDYEKAIAGRRRPKDGGRLYLDLLPFYVDKKDVWGFLGEKAALWSVHTLVHEYPTFDDWLREEGGG